MLLPYVENEGEILSQKLRSPLATSCPPLSLLPSCLYKCSEEALEVTQTASPGLYFETGNTFESFIAAPPAIGWTKCKPERSEPTKLWLKDPLLWGIVKFLYCLLCCFLLGFFEDQKQIGVPYLVASQLWLNHNLNKLKWQCF